jgi:ABC-type uncharacterized transport system permease subunit
VGMQFGWALFFLLLAHILWRAGLKKYTAAGG